LAILAFKALLLATETGYCFFKQWSRQMRNISNLKPHIPFRIN
jgi:hypothetical protein